VKVIRQVCYEGTEEAIRKQLAMSMPEGKRPFGTGTVSIDVRTVYSELPELPPFVERDHNDPHYQTQTVREHTCGDGQLGSAACAACV
jgi:hypothetical protein